MSCSMRSSGDWIELFHDNVRDMVVLETHLMKYQSSSVRPILKSKTCSAFKNNRGHPIKAIRYQSLRRYERNHGPLTYYYLL